MIRALSLAAALCALSLPAFAGHAIVRPASEESVSGILIFEARLDQPADVRSVDFSITNPRTGGTVRTLKRAGAPTAATLTHEFDTRSLPNGEYFAALIVEGRGGNVNLFQTFTIANANAGSRPRPLAFPTVPRIDPPANAAGLEWLRGWADHVSGKTSSPQDPCPSRLGNEPFCRVKVVETWYSYDIDRFHALANLVYWQLAARGEIRPPAPVRGQGEPVPNQSDFVRNQGATVFAYNVARATLLAYNNLPVEGAYSPMTNFVRKWHDAGSLAQQSQSDIIRSSTFQTALNRQFAHNFPEYAHLAALPLSQWPAVALHAREHLIPDLLSTMASRNLDTAAYLRMVEEDRAAGRLPAGFRSFRQAPSVRGSSGECSPASPCRSRSSSMPSSPELLCMDIGNDGRFELWPAEQHPPCGESTRGQIAVFASACAWQPAVCVGIPGMNWKFLGEIRGNEGIPAEVVGQLETAVARHGMALPPSSTNDDVDVVPVTPRRIDKAGAQSAMAAMFLGLPPGLLSRLEAACQERDICDPVEACLATNLYDVCEKACNANLDRCASLELFPPKPVFSLTPSRVKQGDPREVHISHAVPGSEVAIWCQDPSGKEQCSGWSPGATNANGKLVHEGPVGRQYVPGRWCGYAVVAGQRSNEDCYVVEEGPELSFALEPQTVAYGEDRSIIVKNAPPNAEVAVYCQDPHGVEKCSGWKAGTTTEEGEFVETGPVSRDYVTGRWCGYAMVDGKRSNQACYTVVESR